MTATDTIESLQRELDERPDDWFLREVLADALDDVGSTLGPGYRAMGRCELKSCDAITLKGKIKKWLPAAPVWWSVNIKSNFRLPKKWWLLLPTDPSEDWHTIDYPNRRAAEDAAASVFPLLPPETQARYLRGELQ